MKTSCNTSELGHDYQFFVCNIVKETLRVISLLPGSEGSFYLVLRENPTKIAIRNSKIYQFTWKCFLFSEN